MVDRGDLRSPVLVDLHRSYRTRDVAFSHSSVTDYDNLVELLAVLFEDAINDGAVSHLDGLSDVGDTGKHEFRSFSRFGPEGYGIFPLFIGYNTRIAAIDHYGGTDDRLSVGILDSPFDGYAVLGEGFS